MVQKIKFTNFIFLGITLIYLILMCFFEFDVRSTPIGVIVSQISYLIGFIIFNISNFINKDSKIGKLLFLIFEILSFIALILSLKDEWYDYKYGIIFLIYQFVFIVVALLNYINKQKNIFILLLLINTIIFSIVNIEFRNALLGIMFVITHFYMVLYLFYLKNPTIKLTKKNIFIILISFVLFYSTVKFIYELPYLRINNIKLSIEKIDNIDYSNLETNSQKIRYKMRNINYLVSKNITPKSLNEFSSEGVKYEYEGVNIYVSVIDFKPETNEIIQVNGKDFFIESTNPNEALSILDGKYYLKAYTELEGGLYYYISFGFKKDFSMTKDILKNIKPFFIVE